MNYNEDELMTRCFRLAEVAAGRGDTPVGSIVVDGKGNVIAEAGERNRTDDIFAHAEILAIRDAINVLGRNDLTGLTLITTNEPCFLCSYAIRKTAISRVIFARRTPGIGGATSKYPILSASDIPSWLDPPEVVSLEQNNDR